MREDDDTPGQLGQLILFGKVDSVDLAQGRCVVSAGDVVSGPIRWIETRAGATRTWSPPTEGEQVLLLCPEGEIAAAIALRGIFTDANAAPGNSKRELVEFSDGTIIAYDPEAHAFELLAGTGTIKLVADTVTLDADVTITKDLQVDGKVHVAGEIATDDDVKAGAITLKTHKTKGVQPGAGVSQEPVA